MELKVYLPEDGDLYFNNRTAIMERLKDAYIGALFMHYKEVHDQRYHDGLISAGEYARFLATAAEDAHAKAAEIFV